MNHIVNVAISLSIIFSVVFLPVTINIGQVKNESVYAGWIDDWIAQRTENSPNYFEGQKRGYLTGGSFSARWPSSNDYLFSMEPARLKFGCGGIDAFMGGFSFMNFEFLVQKLQRIIAGASSYAFSIALKTLCEPCDDVMKSMEAISDALNSLQLDDCKASKPLVAKLATSLGVDDPAVKAEAEKEFALTKGFEELGTKLSEIWKSKENKNKYSAPEKIAKCPAELTYVFANSDGRTVLESAASYLSFPSEYVDLMRGLAGDIVPRFLTNNEGVKDLQFDFIKPCPENSNVTPVEALYKGTTYKKIRSGNSFSCVPITDTNKNLVEWAQKAMINAMGNMKGFSPIKHADVNFINTVPLPVYSALKYAVATNQEGVVGATLADVTARAYAFRIIADMHHRLAFLIDTVNEIVRKKIQGHQPECQTGLIEPGITKLTEYTNNLYNLQQNLYEDYVKALKESNVIFEYSARYEDFSRKARNMLTGRFGLGVANRAVGR